jgi:hypothetical protein
MRTNHITRISSNRSRAPPLASIVSLHFRHAAPRLIEAISATMNKMIPPSVASIPMRVQPPLLVARRDGIGGKGGPEVHASISVLHTVGQ